MIDRNPGVGPVTATALMATIGNGAAFRKGREFSAWVGMVPKEVSTGGRQKLLGISKRGKAYLRRLFVQGARAVMMRRVKQSPALSIWLEKLTEAACWAHARRKFYDIHVAHASPTTTEVIERIAALYAIEREIRGSPTELRTAVRQSRSAPLLAAMRGKLEITLAKLSPKSDTAAAIRYALSRCRALTRYVEDGTLEIDNNAAERALRVVALGRKNFLFAGSDAGGERAAAIYSLLGSARLNGLDPELYLQHVLERIADHPVNRIHELLPWKALPTPTHS